MKLKRAVVINDLHVPYEDKKSVKLVKQYINDVNPDVVVLNGDIADCADYSKFTLPLVHVSWHEERKQLRAFLKSLEKFKVVSADFFSIHKSKL